MIKNIVFDIGNVLVKWAPHDIVNKVFPNHPNTFELNQKIFKSPAWMDLNRGKMTEKEMVLIYNKELGISLPELEYLMEQAKQGLTPIEGSFELLDALYDKGYPIYSITDNVHEIVHFLKQKYTFFDKFLGAAISADLGVLKPNEAIYHYLLNTYHLKPEECVFIDDLFINIEGAKKVGMNGIQFITADSCKDELIKLGVEF
ncbi:MAG: HAD family phosphatase [Alphaproteobacteria bacterium]|nr:HAD family phosphatase [Alphaproteobacteria bacterium]